MTRAKPCPFCGEKHNHTFRPAPLELRPEWEFGHREYWVALSCPACSTQGPEVSEELHGPFKSELAAKELAIEFWNRRPNG